MRNYNEFAIHFAAMTIRDYYQNNLIQIQLLHHVFNTKVRSARLRLICSPYIRLESLNCNITVIGQVVLVRGLRKEL